MCGEGCDVACTSVLEWRSVEKDQRVSVDKRSSRCSRSRCNVSASGSGACLLARVPKELRMPRQFAVLFSEQFTDALGGFALCRVMTIFFAMVISVRCNG
jgi:hypothetical protein